MAAFTAIAMPALFGILALGFDSSVWFVERRNAQSATDTAVLAAAHAANTVEEGNTIDLDAVVSRSLVLNKFAKDSNTTVTVNMPAKAGPFKGKANTVEVIISRKVPLLLATALLSQQMIISTRAVAGIRSVGEHCVVALDPDADGALTFSGTADANLNCGVASNSKSATSIVVAGSAKLSADPAQAAGDISISGSATFTTQRPPQPYAPPVPDPFSHLNTPTDETCDPAPKFIGAPGTKYTVAPGIYCGTFHIGHHDVTFQAGTIVIRNGDLDIQSNANVVGIGVTIIFAGDTPDDVGTMKIAAGASVTLVAPSSGTYAGIAVMEDRNASESNGSKHMVVGGASTSIKGAIYAPNREIVFSGGSSVDPDGCLYLVGRKVTFNGAATIENNPEACEGLGLSKIIQTRVRLLE